MVGMCDMMCLLSRMPLLETVVIRTNCYGQPITISCMSRYVTVTPSVTHIAVPTHLFRTSNPIATPAPVCCGAATSQRKGRSIRQTPSGKCVRGREEMAHTNTHGDPAPLERPRKAARVRVTDHAHADGLHEHKAWHSTQCITSYEYQYHIC